MTLLRLLSELRQRHVFRVAGAYAAAAFVLAQVTDLVVEPLRLPDWTLRLVIVLVVLGFPLALILAWALELTPQGIRRAAPSALLSGIPLRQRVLAASAGMAAVVALAAVTAYALRGAPAGAPRSIAVLPFADLSVGGDQRYFSDGLAEELMAALSRVEGLQVAARTAAFQFDAGGADLEEVGRRLRVAAVLEGSVRRAADSLRVIVRLVDVHSGYELWTRTYDRQLSDVFAVQEEIAREVLAALRFPDAPGALVATGTTELVAYDHLLRGNHHLSQRTPVEVRRAIEAYRAAAQEDPDYATPLFRQAYAYLVYADWGWPHPELTPTAILSEASALVERGLALAPGAAEGWLARAYLRVLEDPFTLEGALPAFERSLAIDARNAEAWHQYGQSLMVLGRYDDAAAAYHRALGLDPQRAMTLVPLAAMALYRGEYEAARRWADSAVSVDPANTYARASRARTYLAAGDAARALREAELAAGIDPTGGIPVTATLAVALAANQAAERAREAFAAALRTAGNGPLSPTDASNLAAAATALSDADLAISLLKRAQPQGAWFWFYLQSPLFERLRDDPHFRDLRDAASPARRR